MPTMARIGGKATSYVVEDSRSSHATKSIVYRFRQFLPSVTSSDYFIYDASFKVFNHLF